MQLAELKSKIQSCTVPNFLIFTGEEWAIQKIYIDQIMARQNLEKRYMDTVYDVIPKLGNRSFVGNKKYLYLVRDDNKFTSDEKKWETVKTLLGNNMLILLYSKPDKRFKFFKAHEPATVEFSALKPENLVKYIQKDIHLSQKNCLKLIEVCEGNYGRILLEIDKIKSFIPVCDTDYRDLHADRIESFPDYCFRLLLEDGTIYTPPKDAVFDLVAAILDRHYKKVFELYENCKGVNESSFVILVNLFNNAKAVLQVQTCTNKDISKSTGLTGWQIMNAKSHLDSYSNEELISMLQLIHRCIHCIKTGELEEKYVIDYLLVRIL